MSKLQVQFLSAQVPARHVPFLSFSNQHKSMANRISVMIFCLPLVPTFLGSSPKENPSIHRSPTGWCWYTIVLATRFHKDWDLATVSGHCPASCKFPLLLEMGAPLHPALLLCPGPCPLLSSYSRYPPLPFPNLAGVCPEIPRAKIYKTPGFLPIFWSKENPRENKLKSSIKPNCIHHCITRRTLTIWIHILIWEFSLRTKQISWN